MARMASGTVRPSNWPELTSTPLLVVEVRQAAGRRSPESPSPWADGLPPLRAPRRAGATTRTIGSPNFRANSKSRSSCARHGHDGAGAVLHQHVVGDPDRDPLAGRRVDGVAAGEDAGLLPVAHLAGDQVLRRRGLAVGLHRLRAAPVETRRSTSGCSGASTMKVAPKMVSGRVVKTRIGRRSTRRPVGAVGDREVDLARPPTGPASCAGP